MANLLGSIEGLTITENEGVTYATMSGPFGMEITCSYWRRASVSEGQDPWLFKLGAALGNDRHVGPFSHVTERGCQIAIRRFFVDVGCIEIPEDNSHLDEEDQFIAANIAKAFKDRQTEELPSVGDLVRMPDGALHRICNTLKYGAQTTRGGSFSVNQGGGVSFSGSLDCAWLYKCFEATGEIKRARFWFFSHNRPGAGRGVDAFFDCRVFNLVKKPMDRDEASAHPLAMRTAEAWGTHGSDYERAVANLMTGRGG